MTEYAQLTSAGIAEAASPQLSDERLMELVQARCEDSLALLHHRYAALLKGLSMKVLHNHTDAEDLVQEVFVEIWDRVGSYDPLKGKPLSWIATLARRRAIDRLRKRETYHRLKDRFGSEPGDHNESWTHVHGDLAQVEINELLRRALAKLPEAQRSAIQFAYHREMTQREIAAHTGIPLGTIKTRLALGLKKMAAALFEVEDLQWANNSAAAAN